MSAIGLLRLAAQSQPLIDQHCLLGKQISNIKACSIPVPKILEFSLYILYGNIVIVITNIDGVGVDAMQTEKKRNWLSSQKPGSSAAGEQCQGRSAFS